MMKITKLKECESSVVMMEGAKGATRQVPVGKADGAPTFSIRVFTLEPGGHTPHHVHESEHLNYILEGSGVVMEGDTPRTIGKGDFVLVIPGEKHQYRNTGDVPLVFMCMVPSQYE
ncbi:MAG: cupin [Deltaproteobacteria bacterium]|nr:MAG: cupin [Deltaproteobacteria bacterium]